MRNTAIRFGFLFLLSALCGTLSAQKSAKTYFTDCYKSWTITTPTESRRLSLKKVDAHREKLWRLWLETIRESEPQRLIAYQPFGSLNTSKLQIPDSLEPNAVMPYHWNKKVKADGADTTQLPVFVYIHGSGPKDAEWRVGRQWATVFDDAPSLYFIPQIPHEGEYYRWWQRGKQWSYRWLWNQLMTQPGIDADRIYLFGISEGGYGSQRLASFYADYLAAAGPMAGGEPLINAPAENVGNIGLSLLTGGNDDMFCRREYTQILGETLDSLLQAHPGRYVHRVKLIPGYGHGIDYRPTTPWLKQFRRNPYPRHFVWEDFEMDGIHRNGFYNLRVVKRPSDTLRTRYDVDIDTVSNAVSLTIQNVRYVPVEKETRWNFTLRWQKEYSPATGGEVVMFLDEHLVDLNAPVTVSINGREVFHGKPALSTAAMQESIATFGDRRRIYPVRLQLAY